MVPRTKLWLNICSQNKYNYCELKGTNFQTIHILLIKNKQHLVNWRHSSHLTKTLHPEMRQMGIHRFSHSKSVYQCESADAKLQQLLQKCFIERRYLILQFLFDCFLFILTVLKLSNDIHDDSQILHKLSVRGSASFTCQISLKVNGEKHAIIIFTNQVTSWGVNTVNMKPCPAPSSNIFCQF